MEGKFKQLVDVARNRTAENKLSWEYLGGDTFFASIGPGTLRIGRGFTEVTDPDGEAHSVPTYSMYVLDAQGRVVEEEEVNEFSRAPYQMADELFRAARKTALGSDDVIQRMLSALSSNA